jgi:hypothetical protein
VALLGDGDQDAFIGAMRRRAEEHDAADSGAMLQAAPPDQLWLGLDRWRAKFGGS